MKTVPVNFLIKDSPAAVAVLDKNMCFISCSNIWSSTLDLDGKNIIGASYYDVMPNTSEKLKKIHGESLEGTLHEANIQKIVEPNGLIKWLEWKINPWKDTDDEIAGLIITKEDISKRKREEELLLKAERVARIGGWEVEIATNKVYWTQITREIHEQPEDYQPTLEEGLNYYKAGYYRERITELVTKAMTEGIPWDDESIIVTAKGNERWIRTKGEAEIIDGNCVRIFGTFQEIDEEKKAKLKYQEIAERLKVATTGSRIGIWDYDIVNNKLVWDESMYRLYGVAKKDFLGEYEAWRSGLHPDDKQRGDKEIAMAISGEKDFNTEFRIIWPNGEVRYIRAIAVTQKNEKGEVIKMIGTNWDITTLKTTQMMLQKSEESFQGAFENSSTGMALVALNGQLIKTNDSFSEIVGYQREELKKLTFQDITHPDDLDKDIALFNEICKGERESYQLEKRYYHQNGHIIYALLTVTAVKDINGNIEHVIGEVVDLSDRIKAAKELDNMVYVTKKQNDSLMNFAHIVSHNLRSHSTNLSMINGFLNKENDQEEHNNLMRMLGEASESLSETVVHLNEVIQVKVEALDQMKEVSLDKTIKNVKKNLILLIKEKNALCELNVEKDLKLKGMPAYLDSIFLNLFTNSLKYSSPDRRPIVTISSERIGKMVVIHFSDNGVGINLARHGKKLFGMYKTFHRNPDAKGIGLFITKNQIEAMNGKIEVESEVDKGTTFKLYFESA